MKNINKNIIYITIGMTLSVSAFAQKNKFSFEPEQERQKLIQAFKSKYPNIKIESLVYGALSYEPDAKAQYESIMEFPPFEKVIEEGKKLWETPFKNGKTYASCFKNNGKNILGYYPYFDEMRKKVITFEMALNECREKNNEKPYDYNDKKEFGALIAYSRMLSNGMPIQIKVQSAEALKAFNKGKEYFYTRRGQLEFACYHCHVTYFGEKIRSELLSPVIGQAAHWPVFRGGDNLFTIQMRYQNCNSQTRATPVPLASEEYNNLEYFHTYMSNGIRIQSTVFRK